RKENALVSPATISSSAPSAAAFNISEPPTAAAWVSPAMRAGTPVLLSISRRSTSSPWRVQMPRSWAIHTAHWSGVMLLYDTTTLIGAALGPAAPGAAGAPAAPGGATLDGLPPHAAST